MACSLSGRKATLVLEGITRREYLGTQVFDSYSAKESRRSENLNTTYLRIKRSYATPTHLSLAYTAFSGSMFKFTF